MHKIVLTGGGTASHVLPLLSVADVLKKRGGFHFEFIGSKEGIEQEIVGASMPFHSIAVGKLRRYFDLKNITDPIKALRGYLQARALLKKIKPDLVLGKGGYVSLPVVVAASWLKIPVMIHESDSVFGLANTVASRYGLFILTGFPTQFYRDSPLEEAARKRLIFTGVPVRPEFFHKSKSFLRQAGLDPSRKTFLVMGGSQGASRINSLIAKVVGQLLEQFQVIHLTGKLDLEQASRDRAQLPIYKRRLYVVRGFLAQEFPRAVVACDLAVCRAGASTLFELAAAQKPAIVLPLQSAAGNHQRKNADIFKEAGAAVVLDDHQISPEELRDGITKLLHSEYRLEQMANKMSLLAKPDAAEHIAKIILEVTKGYK